MYRTPSAARSHSGWTRGVLAALIVLALLGVGVMAASASEPLRATFSPASSRYEVNDEFYVDIRLEDAVDLHAVGIMAHFNPQVLQVSDADGRADNGVQIVQRDHVWQGQHPYVCSQCNQVDNVNGVITYTAMLMGEEGVTGSGILAQIPFRAVGRGLSPLAFDPAETTADVGNPWVQVTVQVSNGQVQVGPAYTICLPLVRRALQSHTP